jgi:hypothetical protein
MSYHLKRIVTFGQQAICCESENKTLKFDEEEKKITFNDAPGPLTQCCFTSGFKLQIAFSTASFAAIFHKKKCEDLDFSYNMTSPFQ